MQTLLSAFNEGYLVYIVFEILSPKRRLHLNVVLTLPAHQFCLNHVYRSKVPFKSGHLGWKVISVIWLVEIVGVSFSFSFQHHCSFRGPVFLFTNTDSESLQEMDSSCVGWLHTHGDASHAWPLWQTLQYWVDSCCYSAFSFFFLIIVSVTFLNTLSFLWVWIPNHRFFVASLYSALSWVTSTFTLWRPLTACSVQFSSSPMCSSCSLCCSTCSWPSLTIPTLKSSPTSPRRRASLRLETISRR